ncbi:MAG TPA: NADPH:quinone oxidoreductase family protein [Solirubrobacteraceae bacterium]|jgi:NADPH2:quinone reductase|nr:NADPH:quinone oxidoreductase family protein [Solirubrobacteraceae bacterium]
MRAIQITEFGGPEVLRLVDVPAPEPRDGEVLIRVTRAGMNFADTHTRENSYLAKAELPLIPGGEVAGVREDTGERVVALLAGSGGYAEYAVAPAASVVPIPEGLTEETALAMLVQGATAWHLYRTAARLVEGESVVVHAAAGGTGSLCVQLGRSFGAGRVIATASTEEKRALALELGAHAAVDASPEGMAERLIEANGGSRVDVVLEMSGGEVFEESRKALAPFGRLVTYGIASREQNEVRTGSLMRRSHAVVGFWMAHLFERPGMFEQALTDLFARAAAGDLRVVAGPTYPLSEARRAQEDLAGRRTTGKVTLDVTR